MFNRRLLAFKQSTYQKMLLTSLHSLRFTRRLSGVGKNISIGKKGYVHIMC